MYFRCHYWRKIKFHFSMWVWSSVQFSKRWVVMNSGKRFWFSLPQCVELFHKQVISWVKTKRQLKGDEQSSMACLQWNFQTGFDCSCYRCFEVGIGVIGTSLKSDILGEKWAHFSWGANRFVTRFNANCSFVANRVTPWLRIIHWTAQIEQIDPCASRRTWS